MTIKILRPLTKKHGNSKYPNIHEVQILIQRGLNIGISIDTMYKYLTDQEKSLIDRMIINYEYKTLTEYSQCVRLRPERVGQLAGNAYRKLRNCILNKFLIDFCRRKFGLYKGTFREHTQFRYMESSYINRHYTHAEIASEVFDDLMTMQDEDLKKLASITNDIYLSLQ